MKHTRRIKTILASLLVAVALSTPAVVLSSELPTYNAELYFEGAGLEVMADGSVQAVFNISVDALKNCNGAHFYLWYNEDYLTPSYIADDGKGHLQNQTIAAGAGISITDAFFRVDEELYGLREDSGKLVNPFMRSGERYQNTTNFYSSLDAAKKWIEMDLILDKTLIGSRVELDENEDEVVTNGKGPAGKIEMLASVAESEDESSWMAEPVINHEKHGKAEKVTLGQLSFRVKEEHLTEMLTLFQNFRDGQATNDPYVTLPGGSKVALLRTVEESELPASGSGSKKNDPWSVYAVEAQNGSDIATNNVMYGPKGHDEVHRHAEDLYHFSFDGKTVVGVELANPAFTINAYQNYTDGTVDDIARSLGRYSPMATVIYADGTRASIVVSWGEETVHGITADYDPGLGGTVYVPTGGEFHPNKKMVLERNKTDFRGNTVLDETGAPVREYYAFPVPLVADMTVTPITLLDITAPDLERSYTVSRAVSEVSNGESLALPTQARLVTDVVPSGVSLVMPIPGWSPTQAQSHWPVDDGTNNSTLMNALKADNYNPTSGTPYWPDNADTLSDENRFKGNYTFQKAEGYGGALKPEYDEAEIDAAYPWLTTPDQTVDANKGIYVLDNAVRRIVGSDQYTDAQLYEVKYVSTTEPENDPDKALKPTLTLSVTKKGGSMAENSVFRIWLPNGMELGTGLAATGAAAVTVEDWFNYTTETGTTASEGSYKNEGRLAENGDRSFALVTNTGDPTKPSTEAVTDETLAQAWEQQKAKRETLRRYINLGGWFNVAVCENPATQHWSKLIPVYVPPRTNVYTESKEYNFLGENAGLIRFPTPVGTTVTLPHGSYVAVNEKGEPLYDDNGQATTDGQGDGSALNRPTLERWREEYGLSVLYDGQTGAQPGTLYTFTVDNAGTSVSGGKDSWWNTTADEKQGRADGKTTAGVDIFRYGPSPLYHKARYEDMGYIYQADLNAPEKATIRREKDQEREQVWEEVILTSAEPSGITTVLDEHNHQNVSLATFDTVLEGYQVRQDYTFTLTNVGTSYIYGLNIDGLTDGYSEEPTGGRFEILKAPADFLAPGQSTDFVLTYVFNLDANKNHTTAPYYRDTLYITSDNHPQGGKDKVRRVDYLLDFDAEVTVSDSTLHRVDLLVYPDKDTTGAPYPMGNAEIIVGEQRGTTPSTMDYTAATRSYSAGQIVYVAVAPEDEYQFSVTRTNAAGHEETIYTYEAATGHVPGVLGDAVTDGTKKVYCFEMPNENTVVTVRFWEDVFSKLRLEDIIDFSAGSEDKLKATTEGLTADKLPNPPQTVAPENTYTVWRKQFTQEELDAAKEYSDSMTGSTSTGMGREDAPADLYLMTKGRAIPRDEGGSGFVSSENQYIVVIPYEADFSQVEAALRGVVVDRNGLERTPADNNIPVGYLNENKNIRVQVTMTWYSPDCLEYDGPGGLENAPEAYRKFVYHPTYGHFDQNDPVNNPNGYLQRHVSQSFASPQPGTSCYVRIRLEAPSVEGNDSSATEYRHYYLEIHRAPKEAVAQLNYGNSPFGMIMNDETIQDDQKQVAKDRFLAGYTFRGVDAGHVPAAVRENENKTMQNVTYWREAWVKNGRIYEPESFTGQTQQSETIPNPDGTETVRYYMADDPDVYDERDNLDLSEYAYFAILGEDLHEPGLLRALDSSGRPIDVTKVRVSAEVTRLDTAATTQLGRFSGTETVELDLGWSARLTTNVAGAASVPEDGGNYWPMTTTRTETDGGVTLSHAVVDGVRPGRYRMVYTYTDYDGVNTLSVTRDFVILAQVGDVNVDLTRDCDGYDQSDANYQKSDEYVLENRIRDPLGYEAQSRTRTVTDADGTNRTEEVYPYANIFQFRVCDVNNDRNVNNIDGNCINQNVYGSDDQTDTFNRFYDPVHYGRH